MASPRDSRDGACCCGCCCGNSSVVVDRVVGQCGAADADDDADIILEGIAFVRPALVDDDDDGGTSWTIVVVVVVVVVIIVVVNA